MSATLPGTPPATREQVVPVSRVVRMTAKPGPKRRRVPVPGEWIDNPNRACLGVRADVFYPYAIGHHADDDGAYGFARLLCARCPVREDCLAYALEAGEKDGMWGGATPNERRRIIRRARGWK